jgi:S-adenosylmethionine/arginine decarboxylase-like enzyme
MGEIIVTRVKSLESRDEELLEKYQQKQPWGLLVSVDLIECNPKLIRSRLKIKQFTFELCRLLKMKSFGPTKIVHFGDDPKVTGFSLTQLIETSLISGHFANQTNSAYLDIFSCQAFPPYQAAKFCKTFFKAKKMRVKINFRY